MVAPGVGAFPQQMMFHGLMTGACKSRQRRLQTI
jgi:hypothetical protein